MKLTKTYFNDVKIGEECIFKNEFGENIYCVKLSNEKMYHNKTIKYTGQFHSCYAVSNFGLIDWIFAKYPRYLKYQWDKTKKGESKKYE